MIKRILLFLSFFVVQASFCALAAHEGAGLAEAVDYLPQIKDTLPVLLQRVNAVLSKLVEPIGDEDEAYEVIENDMRKRPSAKTCLERLKKVAAAFVVCPSDTAVPQLTAPASDPANIKQYLCFVIAFIQDYYYVSDELYSAWQEYYNTELGIKDDWGIKVIHFKQFDNDQQFYAWAVKVIALMDTCLESMQDFLFLSGTKKPEKIKFSAADGWFENDIHEYQDCDGEHELSVNMFGFHNQVCNIPQPQQAPAVSVVTSQPAPPTLTIKLSTTMTPAAAASPVKAEMQVRQRREVVKQEAIQEVRPLLKRLVIGKTRVSRNVYCPCTLL